MSMTKPTSEQITHNGQILNDVLGPVVNVLAYGAKGDGVTDDFDAFIAAVNAVRAAGGGTVYIPNTPDGYYLRRGTTCDLTGTSGVSIVSDGATLKLQGGTIAQTPGAVFSSTINGFGSGAHNLTIRGLRFESASTVLRYDNGPVSPRHFEDEVDVGQADALEQSSFRYCIAITGASENVVVSDCHFGEYLYAGVWVTDAAFGLGTPARNVILNNLSFEGVGSQRIYLNGVDGLVISNIVDRNPKGSKFDWTVYANVNVRNVTMSDVVVMKSTYVAQFGTSAIGLGYGPQNWSISNVTIENIGMNPFVMGGGAENISVSSISMRQSGSIYTPSLWFFSGCSDISVSALSMIDCDWCIGMQLSGTVKRVSVSDFVCTSATRALITGFLGDCDITLSNGTVVDCSSLSGGNRAVNTGNNSFVRRVALHNVKFVFDTYVPVERVVVVQGASTTCELSNCTLESRFGSSSLAPIVASNSGTLRVSQCSQVGFPALTLAAPFGTGTLAKIHEMPLAETELTVNSATPSVADNELFVTANSSATAITNFTGGVQGQDICVRVNDANTTFDFTGTSLKGNNGVDYTATSGDVLFAKRIGSNWYCTICEA